MIKLPSVLCAITISVLLPMLVSAEQLALANPDIASLEQLLATEVTTVTGASKYQQELTNAPASGSIITADDIRKQGYRSLLWQTALPDQQRYLQYPENQKRAGPSGEAPQYVQESCFQG